jgi:hypothetical protein
MSSHADDKTIDSQASVVGLATGGQIQVGSIHGHGKTQLTDTAATATGTSSLTGIDILGGLIHIDKVSSTATATSDGNKAKGSGSTIVAGVTVAGTPATIDNNGVHLAQSHIPLNGALVPTTAAINQVLGALDLKADLLPTTNTPNGAQVNVIAGALTLTYNVPANISQLLTTVLHNIPQIPNVFQDATVTLALGGATADANASPGFLAGPEPSIEPSSGPAAIAPGVSSAVAGSPAAAASPFASRGSGLAVTAPQLAGRATPSGGGFSSSPLGLFTGLNPGLIVMALVGAVLSSVGLKRLGTGALDPPTGIGCPLKEPT